MLGLKLIEFLSQLYNRAQQQRENSSSKRKLIQLNSRLISHALTPHLSIHHLTPSTSTHKSHKQTKWSSHWTSQNQLSSIRNFHLTAAASILLFSHFLWIIHNIVRAREKLGGNLFIFPLQLHLSSCARPHFIHSNFLLFLLFLFTFDSPHLLIC